MEHGIEMELNPKSLIKNIPNPKEQWKAPVKDVYKRQAILKSIKKTSGDMKVTPIRFHPLPRSGNPPGERALSYRPEEPAL